MSNYRFIGVERIGDRLVAVMSHPSMCEYYYPTVDGPPESRIYTESRFDLPSLRNRKSNLDKYGHQCLVTEQAIINIEKVSKRD